MDLIRPQRDKKGALRLHIQRAFSLGGTRRVGKGAGNQVGDGLKLEEIPREEQTKFF